jgi:hypothetical protein
MSRCRYRIATLALGGVLGAICSAFDPRCAEAQAEGEEPPPEGSVPAEEQPTAEPEDEPPPPVANPRADTATTPDQETPSSHDPRVPDLAVAPGSGRSDADVEEVPPNEDPGESPIEIRAELGEGLTVGAGDAFGLQLRARVQFQVAGARATEGAVADGAPDDVQIEFQIRRMRVLLAGHVLTRDLRYYIQLGFSPRDMEADLLVPVRDAYITWQAHRDIGIRFGQMKVPFGAQRVTSSSALQMVDRSTIVGELNLDRDIGVYLLSEDLFGLGGVFQYQLGVFGGRGRNRFGGLDSLMLAGRILVNPFGSFDHTTEGDHERTERPRLAIGLSSAYNIDSNRARSTHERVQQVARFDFLHLGADVHFKWAGLTVLSEVMFRESDVPQITGTVDMESVTEYARSAWGWFAQVGYMLPFPLEMVARVGEIRPLDSVPAEAGFTLTREVGGAINYYVQQHALKVQLDYFYYWGDDPGAERHQVRLQAQLFF